MSIELPPGAVRADWKREIKQGWPCIIGAPIAGAAGGSELGNIMLNTLLDVKTAPESHLILASLLVLGGSAMFLGLKDIAPLNRIRVKQLKLPFK